jgi:hypothetical protein
MKCTVFLNFTIYTCIPIWPFDTAMLVIMVVDHVNIHSVEFGNMHVYQTPISEIPWIFQWLIIWRSQTLFYYKYFTLDISNLWTSRNPIKFEMTRLDYTCRYLHSLSLICLHGDQRPVQQSERLRLFACARFWTIANTAV